MTSRPAHATKQRPLSAIFLGSSPATNLPDLPEPPILSPSSSSGLPSPPATESNSSGSNGGDSTSGGSLRGSAPKSMFESAMRRNDEPSFSSSIIRKRNSTSSEEDGINDEDHTAKFSNGKKQPPTEESSSDKQRIDLLKQQQHTMLARVSSLTSRSRLSTPSPASLTRRSRSPALSLNSNSASSSKTSHSIFREKRTESPSRRSGSETEREHVADVSSSDEMQSGISSVSSFSARSKSMRLRRASDTASPERSFDRSNAYEKPLALGNSATVGRSGMRAVTLRPESRTSNALEEAALAAVAKTRRESSARRRQPLPLEFRETPVTMRRPQSSLEVKASLDPPSTPRRTADRRSPTGFAHWRSPSSSQAATMADSPRSPRLNGGRFSSRRNQTRWSSHELPSRHSEDVGHSQSRRAGSGDSLLAASNNRGIEKSFRAAGMTWKREETSEDIADGDVRPRRLSGGLNVESRPGTRLSNRQLATSALLQDRTPDRTEEFLSQRNTNSVGLRPLTSLATYRDAPQTDPPRLRAPRSSLFLERDRVLDGSKDRPSSQSKDLFLSRASERLTGSSLALVHARTPESRREDTTGSGSSSEHNRLMVESLRMFESYLTRLPPVGGTEIPELFRAAQSIVDATNKLNTMLHTCNGNANLEAVHYEIERDEPVDPVGIWNAVSGDFRDSARVSDELIRTTTSFLLGVGKLLRDSTVDKFHSRTASLDETISRRHTPDYGQVTGRSGTSEGKGSSDGRSSLDRRRWDASTGDSSSNSRSYISLRSSHPSSSTSRSQTSARSRLELDISSPIDERQELTTKSSKPNLAETSISQRLAGSSLVTETRDALDNSADLSFQSIESPLANLGGVRRSKTLAAPPVLPNLATSDLSRRFTTSSKYTVRLGKQSTASSATVRGHSISLTSSNPTTAVNTTAVQASPERIPLYGMTLSDATRNTISRSTGTILAGLTQRPVEERNRTISAASALEGDVFQVRSAFETNRDEHSFEGRPRMSLDSATTRDPRERRGTVTGLFSRT